MRARSPHSHFPHNIKNPRSLLRMDGEPDRRQKVAPASNEHASAQRNSRDASDRPGEVVGANQGRAAQS